MQVLNGLSCNIAAVVDNTEAVVKSLLLSNLCGNLKNVRNNCAVALVNLCRRLDMLFRNYKDMSRRLRLNVTKGKDCIVLINLA